MSSQDITVATGITTTTSMWLAQVTPWLTALAALFTIVYTGLRIYGWFQNRKEDQ